MLLSFRQVISALHLPKPEQAELKANSVDPYVVVQIFGVPRDCDEVRTKTVYHNCRLKTHRSTFTSLNTPENSFSISSAMRSSSTRTLGESPQFNEAFEFEVAFPELALVRFVVLDDESLDYDFIGQYTLPFDCIQPGSRITCSLFT
jgi:inactive phospholipase C-like protein 2